MGNVSTHSKPGLLGGHNAKAVDTDNNTRADAHADTAKEAEFKASERVAEKNERNAKK